MKEEEFLYEITENQGIIHKVCNLYCEEKENREDLFQEILFQLWKSIKTYNPHKKIKFTTWMYRVALNTAITKFRKSKKSIQVNNISEKILFNLPDSKEDIDHEFKELYQAIHQLTKIERGIILLYLENKNYKEISEIIGTTENNIGVKLNRIKKKLKKILSHE